jgi:hypothetical protein
MGLVLFCIVPFVAVAAAAARGRRHDLGAVARF